MYRTLFTFLGLLAFVPATHSRVSSNRTLLKNPIEIRVTSAHTDSVSFHVETPAGYLSRAGADGRREPASGGTTPAHFGAFAQGPCSLFLPDTGRQIHVKARRMLRHTRHA